MYICQPRMRTAYTLCSWYCQVSFIVYMDPTLLWLYKTLQTNEEIKDDDDKAMWAVAIAIIYTGAKESHPVCIQNHFPSQLYLCHPQLLPNPHINTQQVHFHCRNDCAYITTMGFDVETFELIPSAGCAQKSYKTPIPIEDVNTTGMSR